MITVIDVAKRANVSPSTVSRYIRTPEVVGKKRAAIIEQAIKDLGYTRNLGASFLKSNKTNLVGLILPSSYNTFFANILGRINQTIKELKKQLIVLYASNFDEVKSQIRVLLSFRAESILFIPERKSHTIKTLTLNNDCYPLQLFIDSFPQLDSVIVDDEHGGYLAAKELLEHNQKRILLVDNDNDVFLKRFNGVKKAYQELNIPLDNLHVTALDKNDLIETRVRDAINDFKPEAIISVTEILSQQVCMILQSLSLKVPDDISLVVYDDSTWASLSGYTAICQPIDKIITDINRLIKKKNHTSSNIEKLSISPIIIKRSSIKAR